MPAKSYHHGSLRPALLAAAAELVAEVGPGAVSMREVARRAGVSHAASAHHFGDKRGLFTALAAEGFELLAERLDAVATRTADFVEVGVAYVHFALEHRAHFEVMFRRELQHPDDPALRAAQQRAQQTLYGNVGLVGDTRVDTEQLQITGIAAWSIVHGFATLWLDGALPDELGDDVDQVARSVAGRLFDGRLGERNGRAAE